MEKPSVIINQLPFPNQMASDEEKSSEKYGLSVAKAIEGEWFKRKGNSCRFYDQWGEYHRLRLYARGEQPMQKYKDELAINGDMSMLNLDWTPIPIIPKFVDIVVNGMNDRLYKVKAEAQDVMSAEKKNQFQESIEKDMVSKDFLEMTKQEFGINAFNMDPNELPADDQELSLYMQINYKPGIEIAEEVAIDTILKMNKFDEVKKNFDYDVTTIGIGCMKHNFMVNDGVNVEYVDPANWIHSYTEKEDFSDCYYFGEVKQVHYTELLKINPDLTEEQLTEIKNSSSAYNNYFPIIRNYQDDAFLNEVVTLMYFNYKTSKRFVWKKKILDNGGERVIRKGDTFNPPTGDGVPFEIIEAPREVWYDGILVAGSNILLKWEMARNMVRPKSASQSAMPNYVAHAPRLYKGNIESLVRRMIPFADQIQLTHLKLQQVMSRVVPDGVFIDADGINEVDLGTGAAYNPEDALKLYFQTGSVIGRSYTQEGDFNNARVPIQELNSNSGQSKMAALIGNYNHYLNMIRDVTGINSARDGSSPNPDALVGVQKLAALSSNTATRHILNAGLYATRRLAECISLRVADILEYADFREEFAMQIGKYNVAILDEIRDLYLYDFGIFIEVAPDEEEKQMLEANINVALQQKTIDLEDAIDIRGMNNIKLANEMLKVKRRRRMEQMQKQAQQQQQMKLQSDLQTQQSAAQQKAQLIQLEAQSKTQVKEAEAQFEIQKMNAEVEAKRYLMDLEFQYNMQLKGIEAESLMVREDKREVAKSERISQQNTEQSKLINQRKNNLPPQNFESTEDTLDGFGLESFGPK
tara:strand:- start:1543 stop:3972 length:2430 start_codon:yes stop_codon:yes gene_type:complete